MIYYLGELLEVSAKQFIFECDLRPAIVTDKFPIVAQASQRVTVALSAFRANNANHDVVENRWPHQVASIELIRGGF